MSPHPKCSKCQHKHKKKCYSKCTYKIRQSSFKCHPNGIVLDKPGNYKLCEDIVFRPTVEGSAAITIRSPKVCIDLGKFTLSQGNNVGQINGILVDRDTSLVTVTGEKNKAKVLDFSSTGIRVLGRTDQIVIENVTVTRTEIAQAVNEDFPEVWPTDETLYEIYLPMGVVVGEGDIMFKQFEGTDKENKVTNIKLDCITCERLFIGAYLIFATGVTVTNSLFTQNTWIGLHSGYNGLIRESPDGPIIRSVIFDGVIRNCRFDGNVADNFDLPRPKNQDGVNTFFFDFLAGVSLQGTANFTVEDCTVNSNSQTGFILTAVHNGCENTVWRNCEISDNQSKFWNCDGFHMSGSVGTFISLHAGSEDIVPLVQCINTTVVNCNALGNTSGGGSRGVRGFGFLYTDGAVVSNCHASGTNSPNGSTGFYLSGNPFGGQSRDVTFENCVASSNGTLLEASGTQSGFHFNNTIENVIVKNCVANGNGKVESQISTGLLIKSDPVSIIRKITVQDCNFSDNGHSSSELSGGIIVDRPEGFPLMDKVLIQDNTLTYNEGVGVGVYGDVQKVVIKNNEADNNTGVGFDVESVPGPVLVAKNIAYDNEAGNYAGVDAAVIITADQDTLPDTVDAKNLDIVSVANGAAVTVTTNTVSTEPAPRIIERSRRDL